jgi:uncharacterized protein YndB with AHSA1/START domain
MLDKNRSRVDDRPEFNETTLSISRIFDAPPQLVFDAWIDPEKLLRWYAPTGCTTSFRLIDVRPGGRFHSCIRTPDGHDCWCVGTYREIIEPERLVFTMSVANEKGEVIEPAAAGMDSNWPRDCVIEVTFKEQGEKTLLTLRQSVSETLAKQTGAHPSWLSMFDRLEGLLQQS